MKPENRKFLDDNRHFHTTFVQAQYMKGLNANEREGMQRVMGEEFQPGYATDLWCPPCVTDMVMGLYRRYDEWLAQQSEEVIEPGPEPPVIPPPVDPIKVAASFPSHKGRRK